MELDLPLLGVQHHHAHVASAMVEHQRTSTVLGVTFDGLGYGPDGTLWGGELLVADYAGYERAGHLAAVPMPGGVAAIREPWRMAAVWIARTGGRGAVASALPGLDRRRTDAVLELARGGAGGNAGDRPLAPTTTSMGRLFDAAAALLGGRWQVSYEAQAAIELEALARTVDRVDAPLFDGSVLVADDEDGVPELDPAPLLARLVAERDRGTATALLAAGFHEAIGRASAALAASVATRRGLDTVVLTGGVFQNARLTEVVESELADRGFAVLVHQSVPPNDGGISVGQAAIAAFT
jgi:hydrogenase maturation protein HypF